MKNWKLLSVVLFSFLFIVGCDLDNLTTNLPESEVSSFKSNEGGSVSTSSGAGLVIIPGTVPANDAGEYASVSFSIETEVESPKQLRNGASFKNGLVKFGPENFNFRWPIQLALPYKKDQNPNDLSVMYFDQFNEKWVILPKSGLNTEKRVIYFNSLSLGVFGLAQITSDFRSEDWYDGGFKFTSPKEEYFYTLTVATVANWKYEWQRTGWDPIGKNTTTGIRNNKPNSATYITLPQADYQIWITRTKVGTLSSPPGPLETYTIPASGTLDEVVTCPQSYSTTGDLDYCAPWINLHLPNGGTWEEGDPSFWPVPTKTYGTGDFCATLNWTNNDFHSTDLDLHLYGPNDMHVYYSVPSSSDGSIQLDRDWLTEYGNAIENIFSVKDMPSGKYQVKVKLYSGNPASFSTRIIRNGNVKTYSGHLDTEGEEVLIDEFNL